MADDWQVGDLALCVRGGRKHEVTKAGAVYTVSDLYSSPWGLALLLDEVPNEGSDWKGHYASRFRKIRPHEADAEDRETIALLTGKPAQVPA